MRHRDRVALLFLAVALSVATWLLYDDQVRLIVNQASGGIPH